MMQRLPNRLARFYAAETNRLIGKSLMRRLAFALFLLLPFAAAAQTVRLEVKDAWTRASVGGTANAAVYMTITSQNPDRLIAASTPVANKTDLMTMEGGSNVMEMKYVKVVDIPANKPVSLNPSGLHVWLAGLKRPLKAGEAFPLTLTFAKAGRREVTVSVQKPGAAPPMSGMRM
jgi:copper(I)-binding protein